MPELMTLEEVASYLRVTEKTIYRLVEKQKIPATRVGHQWRFDKSRIDQWLHNNSVGSQASILIIDDERAIHALFKGTLEEMGHKVISALNAPEGLELFKQQHIDLVFLDLKMPGMDGAELFGKLKLVNPNIPVVIITGYPNSQLMAKALTYGPFSIINKPFTETDIITVAKSLLRITGDK